MNRLHAAPSADVVPSHVEQRADLAAALYAPAAEHAPCAIFGPLHYEANYAYPLLIWLHGPHDDEQQLKRIMPLVSMRNYVAAAPRGTVELEKRGRKAGCAWRQCEADIEAAEERVLNAVQSASDRFHVNERRVFLAGYDCGGSMALRVAMNHPDRFAGALSLGGEFPRTFTPLARLPEARKVPVLICCGRDSAIYPAEQVCDDLRLLHSAGMNVALRQYPGGHEIGTQMLADMDRWIMEQIGGMA